MEITASQVKELREKTGAGMLDCKKALQENAGDFEKAVDYLRKKGIASAAKKAGRATKEGTIFSYIPGEGNVAVLLEVNCETDFVAKTEQFKSFVKEVAMHIAEASKLGDTNETLMKQPFIKDSSKTVEVVLREAIATLGENMTIGRFARWSLTDAGKKGAISSYIHGEGRVAVLLEANCENDATTKNEGFKTFVKDVAMHIAAANPSYVVPAEVPADIIAKEKEIAVAQMAASGKPAAVLEKIAEGKINKYFEDTCLVKQAFVKDPGKSIEKFMGETGTSMGDKIAVRRFVRWALGENSKSETEETTA
jgi:elongation factor Ts